MKVSCEQFSKHLIKHSFLAIFLLASTLLLAQKKAREFSPRTASIYSAVVPGAGQIYNKKYWKVPLVFAAIGTSVYYINRNTKEFNSYKRAIILRQDGNPQTVDIQYQNLSDDLIRQNIDFYQRLRDISYFALAASYILNIVDASVDAHLKEFDVSDDLSLSFTPSANKLTLSPGLTLSYSIK